MADINTASATVLADFDRPIVDTKSAMVVANAWVFQPYIRVREVHLRVNGWDRATLTYQFGASVKQPGIPLAGPAGSVHVYADTPPLDLSGHYAKISFGGFVRYFYILGTRTPRGGTDADGDLYGGVQLLDCVGLPYFLDRVQIRSAVLDDNVRIQRGLTFNEGAAGYTLGSRSWGRGNKHFEDDANGLRGFYNAANDATSTGPTEWTATDIAKHLLWYHGPRDELGDQRPCPFVLTAASAAFLNSWKPSLRTAHRSTFESLNALINPSRGVCWWATYDDDAGAGAYPFGKVDVHVGSLSSSVIALAQGGTLPAAASQLSLSFDDDSRVERAVVGGPQERAYRRIVCRGARQTGTLTMGVGGDDMAANWTVAQRNQVLAAASDATIDATFPVGAKYADLSTEQQAIRNDMVRSDEDLQRVYSAFQIPFFWDGKSADGKGTGTPARDDVFPIISVGGSIGAAHPHYWSSLRVLSSLLTAPGKETAPDGDEPEYGRPFATVKVSTGSAGETDRHAFVDRLVGSDYMTGAAETTERPTSYYLFAERQIPGVRVESSKINHTLAGSVGGLEPTQFPPELNYQTLRFTFSLEADAYAEGAYPDVIGTGLAIEELVIDFGDQYRLDYVAPNTLVNLVAGEDVLATGGVIRNDQAMLADFARFAYEWYSQDKKTLSLTLNELHLETFDLGTLITTVGEGNSQETLNTVIGAIEFDFHAGTTTVQTIEDVFNPPELLST